MYNALAAFTVFSVYGAAPSVSASVSSSGGLGRVGLRLRQRPVRHQRRFGVVGEGLIGLLSYCENRLLSMATWRVLQ